MIDVNADQIALGIVIEDDAFREFPPFDARFFREVDVERVRPSRGVSWVSWLEPPVWEGVVNGNRAQELSLWKYAVNQADSLAGEASPLDIIGPRARKPQPRIWCKHADMLMALSRHESDHPEHDVSPESPAPLRHELLRRLRRRWSGSFQSWG